VSLALGLNALFLGERAGGAGRYARGLLGGLAQLPEPPRITVFAGSELPEDLAGEPWADEVEWVRLRVAPSNPLNLAAQMVALPWLAARRGVDVLHSPANVGPLLVPRAATVVTLLDLIWLHYPDQWDHRRRVVRSTRTLSLRCARAATRVIAISEAARQDFVRTIGLSPGRVDVTPLAGDVPPNAKVAPERELRTRLGIGSRPFVLSVAQKRGYKRLDTAIRAVAALEDLAPGLVLVGPPTPHEEDLRRLALELGVQDRVRFLDWISEEELEGLYRASACFVLPSMIEGFGLPVLEAMHRGVPVACSNRTSLPEVTGDAALLFDPDRQEEVTGALRRLLSDPGSRDRLGSRGRARATTFTWRRTAEKTMASYQRAVRENAH
jgi:glycosyltransferase involved in cell wall biosynthesis